MADKRIVVLLLALIAGMSSIGCGESRYLAVDLRTDLAAGVEYDEIEVSLDGLTVSRVDADTDRGDRPRRVFERENLAPGVHAIELELLLDDTPVASRRVQFSIEGSRIVTVIISRDCREVGCPTTGATECLGGQCVSPECTTLGEPGCAEAECSTSADCTASVACARGLCVEGACLEVPVLDACGASMVCVPEEGCVSVATSDAGTGGVDASGVGVDAGTPPIDTGLGPVDSGGTSGPFAPVAPPTNSVWTVEDSASPPVVIGASDADGDIVGYAVSGGPFRGSVSFDGDTFVFTPTAGAVGTDGFTIRVTDSGGRFVDQVVSVTIVPLPSPTDWRYTADEGEAVTLGSGSVGGGGEVFGTNGLQEIVIADAAGLVRLDPSFNRSNDIVRLFGSANSWRARTEGSNATLTNGSTFVQIPAGSPGVPLVFGDGARTLRIASSRIEIGAQTITGVYLPIDAPAQVVTLPPGIDPAVRGDLIMFGGGMAVVGGRTDLFGTNGIESVTLLSGNIQLDGSFNRGGDTITFPTAPGTFQASYSGSQVIVANSGLTASIPVGMPGVSLVFAGATRTLRFDGTNILIGTQIIRTTPAPIE